MLKKLLEDIATAHGWAFQFGTPAMFNVSADDLTLRRPVLFMSGFGRNLSVTYDMQDAAVPTYRLDLFLSVHSKLTDLAQDRSPYFEEVEGLANRLSQALYRSGDWTGESRLEVINVNDLGLDGLRIQGNLKLTGVRLC